MIYAQKSTGVGIPVSMISQENVCFSLGKSVGITYGAVRWLQFFG